MSWYADTEPRPATCTAPAYSPVAEIPPAQTGVIDYIDVPVCPCGHGPTRREWAPHIIEDGERIWLRP